MVRSVADPARERRACASENRDICDCFLLEEDGRLKPCASQVVEQARTEQMGHLLGSPFDASMLAVCDAISQGYMKAGGRL